VSSRPPESVTVIFDGRCGFCTAVVQRLLDGDRHHRVTAIPCQTIDGVERFGLTEQDCLASVRAVAADGRRETGAQAAVLITAVLLGRSWPLRIGRLPGVRQLLALGYRLVASIRHRLPGAVPWCEAHPGACLNKE